MEETYVEENNKNVSDQEIIVTDLPKKKQCRKEYNVTNRSCEIVVNGLKEITKKYEKSCKSVIKVVKASPRTKFKTHFCVTAMPEFMERVHSLDFSNRVIFLDGTGNANRFNCSVFVLMIDSHVGALPFGFFITSYKSASLLEPTFNALPEIMPNNAFNNPSFPKIVITGIDQAEYTAITKCFHGVKAYIGTFHLLREIWRYIWDSENCIEQVDRPQLYKLFKDIILSQNEEQLNCNIFALCENATSKKYPEFLKYFNSLLKKKDLWSLDFRVRNNMFYNKNILTSEMHVLKENILYNSRTYSVSELFEYFCTKFCDYYKSKITEAASGTLKSLSELRYMPNGKDELIDFKVSDMCCEEVLVVNIKRNSEYYINKELGTCTCVLGKHGTPCIHQYVVAVKYKSELFVIAPMNLEEKGKYCYLATGLPYVLETPNTILNNLCQPSQLEENSDELDYVTEYVVVSHSDTEFDLAEDTRYEYTSEDCINAIEIFWSKLSPYTKDHANEIHRWISMMNRKLDQTKSFSDVINILYGKINS